MNERPIDLSSAVVDDLQGEFNEEVLSSVPAEFLTGPAGTGKTFQIMGRIQENPKYGVLAATTGVAAVNLGSITINSLLKYFDTDSLHDRYMSGKLNQTLAEIGMDKHNLVIDECSMMCADQLDIIFKATSEVNCRSKFKRNPLGIVLVGDMAQLAPVKAKWVFEAKCWPAFARNVTSLTKIHRQSDPIFIEALSQARRGDGLAAVDLLLKSGVKFTDALDTHFEGTTIVPKNADVGRFNYIALQRVQGRMLRVRCIRRGKQRREWLWNASTFTGIPDEMGVKINSLVMILANDTPRFTYVNGDLGYVRDYENGKFLVELLRNGAKVYVGPVTREIVQKDEPSESYEDGFPILTEQGWVLGTITYYPLRAGYASTTHKCVMPETLVYTEHGLIMAGSVAAGNKVFSGGSFSPVATVASVEKRVWRVKTKHGYELLCSGDHPIFTLEGFTPAKLVKKSDRVRVVGSILSTSPADDPDLMWLMGALVGDGTYTDMNEGQLHFSSNDPYMQGEYLRIVDKYGIKGSVRRDGKGCHTTSKPFRNRLLQLGLVPYKAECKRIPVAATMSKANATSFLLGLFDADGSVYKSGVVYCTASQTLSKEVQLLLLAIGIPSSRATYTGVNGPYYQIRIGAAGLEEFRRKIGFSRPYKKDKLERCRPNRIISRWDGWDDVVSVEDLGVVVRMVDFEIDTHHQFVADGILTHNSQGLTLDRVQIDCRGHFFGHPNSAYVALSRARTSDGLRIVGPPEILARRIQIAQEVLPWV